MTPGHYTELFFLDEVTALAAGHRPCFECRRADAKLFSERWFEANPSVKATGSGIGVLDRHLREERADGGTTETVREMPNGTVLRANDGQFYALRNGMVLPWSFSGYGAPLPLAALPADVRAVTSPSIRRALRAGYRPQFHSSASTA
jgi:hypothetical protein